MSEVTTPVNKFKSLVNKRLKAEASFMGEKVEIRKLSVAEVLQIQEKSKDIAGDESKAMDVLIQVIKCGCAEAADVPTEDFKSFPMDELSNLQKAIMVFSGISGAEEAGK